MHICFFVSAFAACTIAEIMHCVSHIITSNINSLISHICFLQKHELQKISPSPSLLRAIKNKLFNKSLTAKKCSNQIFYFPGLLVLDLERNQLAFGSLFKKALLTNISMYRKQQNKENYILWYAFN